MQHKTLPLLFGVTVSKVVSLAFLAVFYLIIANINQEIWQNVLLGSIALLAFLLVLFTNSTRSIFFFAALDGTMGLIGLVSFYN